jgi:hypothetical protein
MARAFALLLGFTALAAGCGSGGGRATMTVRERFEPIQVPNRIIGTARGTRDVRTDCSLGAVYTVREATGTAFLTQSELIHLHLSPPRSGTSYEVECLGPLVAELPAAATRIEAAELIRSGHRRGSVPVRTHASVRLAPGRPLRPAAGKQFVVVEWPRRTGSAHDDYRLELSFELPKASLVRERVAYTAAVTCGGTSYLAPVVPLDQGLGFVNAFTVPEHGKPFDFILPRLAAGISSHNEETQSLSCSPAPHE